MRTPGISLGAAAAVVLLASAGFGAPPAGSSASSGPGIVRYAGTAAAVAGSYLVVLPGNTTPAETTRRAGELNARHGGTVRFTYTAALKGFATRW